MSAIERIVVWTNLATSGQFAALIQYLLLMVNVMNFRLTLQQ